MGVVYLIRSNGDGIRSENADRRPGIDGKLVQKIYGVGYGNYDGRSWAFWRDSPAAGRQSNRKYGMAAGIFCFGWFGTGGKCSGGTAYHPVCSAEKGNAALWRRTGGETHWPQGEYRNIGTKSP